MPKPIAIVLHSGGLDSTTCLAIAREDGYTPHALAFDYGQRHNAELICASNTCQQQGIPQTILPLPIAQLGGSSLTDNTQSIPDYSANDKIPSTYVPARNLTFLSFAVGLAEVLDAKAIYIGVSSVDFSGYPDCRPEFIEAFAQCANLATKAGVEGSGICIKTPLSNLSKAQTIERGIALGVDYSQTVSCYQATPDGLACGRCDSCHLRRKGFLDANTPDVTRYVTN